MKRKSLGFSIVFLALLFTVNPAAPFCRLACAADQGENTSSLQGRCLDGHDLQTRLAGTGVTVNIKYADMEKRTWVQSSSNKGICDERGEFSFPNIPFDPSKTRAHVQVIVTKQGFIGGLHVFVPDPKEKKIHFSFGLLDRNEKALVKGVIRDLITGKSILCGSVDLLLSSPGEKGTKSESRHRIAADTEGRFVAKVDPLYVNSLDRSTSHV